MLKALQNKNIRYIIEDNLTDDNQNIPKKIILLITRTYPGTIYKINERISETHDRITLYGINYQAVH